MSIEEVIKELEHTIEYFEGCADKFQLGRKCQAMITLEQLQQCNVSSRNEQLVCPNCKGTGYISSNSAVTLCLLCGGKQINRKI